MFDCFPKLPKRVAYNRADLQPKGCSAKGNASRLFILSQGTILGPRTVIDFVRFLVAFLTLPLVQPPQMEAKELMRSADLCRQRAE